MNNRLMRYVACCWICISQLAWADQGHAETPFLSTGLHEYTASNVDPDVVPILEAAASTADSPLMQPWNEIALARYQQSCSATQVYSPFRNIHHKSLGRNCDGNCAGIDFGFVARGYYLNDARIQWSGLEATAAGEGALYGNYHVQSGDWIASVETELFLNQPSDKNILVDTQERRSYLANYDFDPLELSRLNVAVRNGDWELRMGKMWTPFGRYYPQLWSNQLLDAPFIRTESIRWRETGLLLRWDPGLWVIDGGIFNGHYDRDANSAKAVFSRIGMQGENWALGGSIKFQDGSGSEDQKTFSRYAGFDAMVKQGRWQLSSEVIYDEYGLRRPSFDPLDIFWEKSIYYRDLNDASGDPISGVGYYVALDYLGPLWTASASFGQFFPETIGNFQHDRTQNRGVLKLARAFGANLQLYSVFIKETEGYIAQAGRPRRGSVLLTGLQFAY